MTPFKITTDGLYGTVEVDGRDITAQVAGLTVDVGHGDVTRLTLHVRPHTGTIEGVAVIEQAVAGPPSDLVRQLDPSIIRERHMARGDTVTADPYQAMLDIVADLLDQTGDTDE